MSENNVETNVENKAENNVENKPLRVSKVRISTTPEIVSEKDNKGIDEKSNNWRTIKRKVGFIETIISFIFGSCE